MHMLTVYTPRADSSRPKVTGPQVMSSRPKAAKPVSESPTLDGSVEDPVSRALNLLQQGTGIDFGQMRTVLLNVQSVLQAETDQPEGIFTSLHVDDLVSLGLLLMYACFVSSTYVLQIRRAPKQVGRR
jgi:hypothetical protein